jgi:hypothetical protein
MADKEQINPESMAIEANLSKGQAERALEYLIENGWLFRRHVKLDETTNKHRETTDGKEPGSRHYHYDSAGHLWVDLSAVADGNGVVIDRPDTEQVLDSEVSLEEDIPVVSFMVSRSVPPELLIETDDYDPSR